MSTTESAQKDNPGRKRPAPHSYRPPTKLADEFEARVRSSGLNTNAFITQAVFSRKNSDAGTRKLLARLLLTCAEIKDFVRFLNEDEELREVSQHIETELRIIRTTLMKLLGRRS